MFSDLFLVKYAIAGLGGFLVLAWLLGVRHIPNNKVGIVEKLWSLTGSLSGGRIIAFNREAGFQADLLRGGIHFGYFPFQYRIHKEPLVTIAEARSATSTRATASRCRRRRRSAASSSATRSRTRGHS